MFSLNVHTTLLLSTRMLVPTTTFIRMFVEKYFSFFVFYFSITLLLDASHISSFHNTILRKYSNESIYIYELLLCSVFRLLLTDMRPMTSALYKYFCFIHSLVILINIAILY